MKELYNLIENKIGMDKVAHFFGVGFIAFIVALIFTKTNPNETSWVHAFIGFFAGGVVAVVKEAIDFCYGRIPDKIDILAGLLGATIAFLCVGLLL